jgi:signal peptidase II
MMSEQCIPQGQLTCPTQTIKAPYLLGLAAAGDVFLVDIILKYIIYHELPLGQLEPIVPQVVSLTHAENTGVAFSFLKQLPAWGLACFSIALVAALLVWLLRGRFSKGQAIALGLIIGGGLNNALNRAVFGFVMDYIHLDFVQFAVFNLSDIAINVGVLMFVWMLLRSGEPPAEALPPHAEEPLA